MLNLTLTEDQENAMFAFGQFLSDPTEQVFVLKGYSGTGKTTLITHLLDQIPRLIKTAKLLNPRVKEYPIELTATTNKAAENFSQITGGSVSTIQSFLGLRVQTDYTTGQSTLVPVSKEIKMGYLLFIDEASYIDSNLLDHIFRRTRDCKIVFIGDPAQLTPVKTKGAPVFEANFKEAVLKNVVRNTGPILELSTAFRHTVESGEFFSFTPDGDAIKYLDRDAFMKEALAEFSRPDWRYKDSKILAWTNKRVIEFNHYIRDQVSGNPQFVPGDYAVCNQYVSMGKKSIKTDATVYINNIVPATEHGVAGAFYSLDYAGNFFMPHSLEEKKTRLKLARDSGDWPVAQEIQDTWIDLRAAYAQTVNKAQGSTYDKVFIDLDDIRRCNSGEQIARMLYVAVSRARNQVVFTGDLV